jgi:DNA (cytosine-5)-methyltransferase 1
VAYHVESGRAGIGRKKQEGITQHSKNGVAYGLGAGLEEQCFEQARSECEALERGGSFNGMANSSNSYRNPWADLVWLPCSDGKARPTQPGLFPLASRVSGRMVVVRAREQGGTTIQETHQYSRIGALKGFGNSIVPQLAAEFINAAEGAINEIIQFNSND